MSTATRRLARCVRDLDTKIMPEKITLADGTEREVPTVEEQEAAATAQKQLEELKPVTEQFNKLKEELEIGEGETLEDKLKELKESANPNWQKTRALIKTLKEAAKAKGIEVNDDGEVVTKPNTLTKEEAEKIAASTFSSLQNGEKKTKALANFPEEEKKSIETIYDKLSVLGGTFEENMSLAIAQVKPETKGHPLDVVVSHGGGGAPITKKEGTISSDVKAFGLEKFGLKEEDFNNV